MNLFNQKLKFSQKVGYALGDGAANIAWRGVSRFLFKFGAAIFSTFFFAMLGDAADYSEHRNGRWAIGHVYSEGSFATRFGGCIAGAIIGFVLGAFHYNGQDELAIQGDVPGIIMLMSWIPTIIALIAAGFMTLYPLTQKKMDAITIELGDTRAKELAS